MNYQELMKLALSEAQKGIGFVSPNPMVGAVIVKNNQILATGYHHQSGLDHAEVDAIKKLSLSDLQDATMIVTLEPCCHHGKTPPCTDAIIRSGIKKVVIGSIDCDDRVCGKSIPILKKAGIEVISGILDQENRDLNSIFFYYQSVKRPYIVMKAAMTLDGKIACFNEDSKWISNGDSRSVAHRLRLRLKAIAVGRKTVETDHPRLNCRLEGFENKPVDKLIFTGRDILPDIKSMEQNPGRIFKVSRDITRSPEDFLNFCLKNEIDSILIEGGSEVYTWFLKNDLIDRVFLFYKPAFMGSDGIPVINQMNIDRVDLLNDFVINKTAVMNGNLMVDLTKGAPLCLLES